MQGMAQQCLSQPTSTAPCSTPSKRVCPKGQWMDTSQYLSKIGIWFGWQDKRVDQRKKSMNANLLGIVIIIDYFFWWKSNGKIHHASKGLKHSKLHAIASRIFVLEDRLQYVALMQESLNCSTTNPEDISHNQDPTNIRFTLTNRAMEHDAVVHSGRWWGQREDQTDELKLLFSSNSRKSRNENQIDAK